MDHTENIVNLFHEVGMLADIPRSGFAFLGSGKQSVAEHSFRVTIIAHTLARLSPEKLDLYKLVMMCLFHDLPEARIGDLNYVQKRYLKADINKAIEHIANGSQIGPEIVEWIKEYEEGKTLEAKLAHDADQLELMLVLKKEFELGNPDAFDWYKRGKERLKTDLAINIANKIWEIKSNSWWQVK